jgi:putative DNA primase/helicase
MTDNRDQNGQGDRPSDPVVSGLADTFRQQEAKAEKIRPARKGKRPSDASSEAVLRHFKTTADGLYWISPDPTKPDLHVCGPLQAVARTRDEQGQNWGVLLQWNDRDGREHEWAMPHSLLAGDAREVRANLLDRGLYVSPHDGSRKALMSYLSAVSPAATAMCVSRGGWHSVADQAVFVLPDQVYGAPASERVVLQTTQAHPHAFREAGTIEDWRHEIGRYAVGNSRLGLAIAAAFAAPLVEVAGEESGGINFQGGSRLGKSTALRVAGSVWGGGGLQGYIRQWRGTANGLEGVAAQHCDALLCLDEMGQVDPREAGESAYLLANGAGKSRADRGGLTRTPATWRTLFLSTGEVSLAEKMQEVGQRARVGQEVRLVDVPADAGAGHGMFERLHEFPDGDSLARHLRETTAKVYGTSIRVFLKRLTGELAGDRTLVADEIRQRRDDFIAANVPAGSSGQVLSVAGRFALVAAAGTFASEWGITGWPVGEANRAAGICFRAWLDRRGTTGAGEVEAGIAHVMQFIEAHGASRFEMIGEAPRADSHGRAIEQRTINRVGFKRYDGSGSLEYLVLSKSWAGEVCKGHDARLTARALYDRSYLRADLERTKGKLSQTIRIPGHGLARVYVLSSNTLGQVEAGTDTADDDGARRTPDLLD